MAEFDHPQLVKLEWAQQIHRSGTEVLLPIIPGPFGDRKFSILDRQDRSANAKRGLGFNAGSEHLRWFYADEMLDRLLLNETLAPYCKAPLTDLYENSEHFYTEMVQ